MRFSPFLLLALAACERAPDAPPADGDGSSAVTTSSDVIAGASAKLDGLAPGFIGATAPEAAYDLGEGAVCYVYGTYAVRVSPAGGPGELGEPRGDEVAVGAREGDGQAACAGLGSRVVSSADSTVSDTFMGVEGDVLLLDRASGEAGQAVVAVDLAADDAVVLDSPYEGDTVEIEGGVLRFGTLARTTRSVGDLAGVDCPQGAEFIESGLDVGIIREVTFDLAQRERADTDRLACTPIG